MSVSRAWALICALFTPNPTKGAFNLELANDATGAGYADLVADASTTAVGADTVNTAAAAAPATAADTSAAVFIPGDSTLAAAISGPSALALGGVSAGASDSGALAGLDADDEHQSGEELESLKAIAGGGVDLFVTVLKDLVSFAMDLGHDFDTAYDKSVARAKVLAAKL